jgi:hypothetical protein
MMMLTKSYGRHVTVRKYVMRCLGKATDEELVFWLPQIIQSLRTDADDESSLSQCDSEVTLKRTFLPDSFPIRKSLI